MRIFSSRWAVIIQILALCATQPTFCFFAEAQQSAKIPRIGILPPGPISERVHLWNAFRQGLRELGYVEGKNITLVFPSTQVQLETLSHVVKLRRCRSQTRFDISERLAIGQLRKSQRKKLIPARKTLDLVIALIVFHAAVKFVSGSKVHQLSKDCFAGIHPGAPPSATKVRKYGFEGIPNSNRLIGSWLTTALFSEPYGEA